MYIGTTSEATKGWGDVAQKDSQQRMLQVVLVSPQVRTTFLVLETYHVWFLRNIDAIYAAGHCEIIVAK